MNVYLIRVFRDFDTFSVRHIEKIVDVFVGNYKIHLEIELNSKFIY